MKQRVARARVCFFGGLLVLALSLPGLAAQVAEAVGPSVFSVRFEEGEAAGLWSANPQGGAKASIRVEPGPGRGRSLRVEKSGVQGFVQWQSAPVSVETGTSYRVSAWLNTLPWDRRPGGGTPTAASVYFMVSQFGGGKGQPARSNSFGPVRPFYSSGSQWEKLEMAFQTRPDTERVTLSLIFTHDAVDLLVDDICLERQAIPSERAGRLLAGHENRKEFSTGAKSAGAAPFFWRLRAGAVHPLCVAFSWEADG